MHREERALRPGNDPASVSWPGPAHQQRTRGIVALGLAEGERILVKGRGQCVQVERIEGVRGFQETKDLENLAFQALMDVVRCASGWTGMAEGGGAMRVSRGLREAESLDPASVPGEASGFSGSEAQGGQGVAVFSNWLDGVLP